MFSLSDVRSHLFLIIEIYNKCSSSDVLLLTLISGSGERTGRVVLLSRGGSEGPVPGQPAHHGGGQAEGALRPAGRPRQDQPGAVSPD